MKNFNSNTTNSEEWLTPPEILAALGSFDLDPCAPVLRPWDMAKKHYTKLEDGLKQPWEGRVWLNPPYGKQAFVWMERLALHGRGIALIFARTETKGFQETVFQKATAILFIKGRLSFFRPDGSRGTCANAPSCLVAYGLRDYFALREANYDGKIQGKFLQIKV